MSGDVDYSKLPCVVWVNIMKYLSLNDRYQLSVTNRYLYEYFSHPSLWSKAYIKMIGGYTNFHICSTLMSDKCVKLIQTFGHLFQNLHIQIDGHFGQMEEQHKLLLQSLAKNCRLQVLTLEVGLMISRFHLEGNLPENEDLASILLLVQNATRLKELNIISWPMYPALLQNPSYNIFQVMKNNDKIKSLESLNLFWMKECSWSERHPILPSAKFTEKIVHNFKNLKRLSLRSPMLSEELIIELITPGRAKLDVLQIFITYSAHHEQYQMPHISGESWDVLKSVHPTLEVDCTIMSRIGEDVLGILLKPEVPLKSLTILRHSKCGSELLLPIADKFHNNLKSFICHCDASGVDEPLVQLVASCSLLTELVFYGEIYVTTLMKLAEFRGKAWKKFVFVEKSIKTEFDEDGDDDDDVVLKQDSHGSYQLKSLHRFHREDEERDTKIDNLNKWISEVIGFPWRPLAAIDSENQS
ncbi:hypothetical protein LOTGIDRAFT_205446 [Lottia gigantea]|uniref:F-box domain-containing protein n=1 Tax=Lottia gigantea TaxID=225164 RepID=V4BZN9_LOTGI|nr:hypothetical protein LOTGIDRAFT_205446 [Lottia gigantea]ESO94619.1 hypothetical protein LOTGIDRAFT_205446 [Lottia gigantea]